jgi:hypothetical protein
MKMNSAQIERTLDQFEGEVVPEDNPVLPQLKRIFGDHTYFLDQTGLNIVEPGEADHKDDVRVGVVVNIADWADTGSQSLAPHAPEKTGLVVLFSRPAERS